MTQLLQVRKDVRGKGSGYRAAILAMLAQQVYTIEIVPELAASSAAPLKRLGCRRPAEVAFRVYRTIYSDGAGARRKVISRTHKQICDKGLVKDRNWVYVINAR